MSFEIFLLNDETVYAEPFELEATQHLFYSRVYVCPTCGIAWGKRAYVDVPLQLYQSVDRPCAQHSCGGLTRGRDYESTSHHTPEFLAFLVDQYFLDPSVIFFND